MGFDKRTFNSRFALRDESIEGILDLATLLKAAIGAAAANWRLVPRCGHLGALKCCNIDQGPLCGLRPQHFDRPMDVSFGPFLLLTQKGQRPGRSAKLPVTALELNGYFFTTLRARGGTSPSTQSVDAAIPNTISFQSASQTEMHTTQCEITRSKDEHVLHTMPFN